MSAKHAVIIDDNPSNVNVLAEMLRQEGLNSTRVLDPAKLESALVPLTSVDVVFLDLEMPHLDGYQVFEQLRADTRFQDVPFVVYSVHTAEISHARQVGFNSFLGKPLNADQFPNQLARILNGESVWEVSSIY